MGNSILGTINISRSQEIAAATRPNLAKLYSPDGFSLEIELVVQNLLNCNDLEVRNWVKKRLALIQDKEMVQRLTPAPSDEKLLTMGLIAKAEKQIQKIEDGFYNDLHKEFEETRKERFNLERNIQSEKQNVEDLKYKIQELDDIKETLDTQIQMRKEQLEIMRNVNA